MPVFAAPKMLRFWDGRMYGITTSGRPCLCAYLIRCEYKQEEDDAAQNLICLEMEC